MPVNTGPSMPVVTIGDVEVRRLKSSEVYFFTDRRTDELIMNGCNLRTFGDLGNAILWARSRAHEGGTDGV
jgi:hypothetical protein